MTLNAWGSGLLRRGPAAMLLKDARAGLVDLHRPADDELVVERVADAPWGAEHAHTLLQWAATVGYRRVWLPDRPVDLDASAAVRRAFVTCPTCGLRWEDDSPEFWESVLEAGHFPGYCLGCGGSLPEWSPEPSVESTASLVGDSLQSAENAATRKGVGAASGSRRSTGLSR